MSSDLKISQMTFSGARPVNNDIPWVGGTPIDNYRSTLQDITGMYYNFTAGDRALAGVPTAGWAAAGGVYFVVNGGAIYPYLARAGTDAQSVPNIIRPTDYAGGTNELVYDLLTFYTDGVIVGNGSITDTTPGLVVAAGGSGNRNIFLTPTGASGNVTVGTSGILVLDNGAAQATFSAAGTAVWTGAASLTPGAGTNLNISLTSTALASVTNSSGATMRLNNTGTTAVSQYELYASAASFGSLSYAPAGGANDGLIIRDGRADAQAKIMFQLQSAEVARLVAGNLLLGTTTNTSGSGNLVVAGGTITAGSAATPLTLSGGSSGASLVLGNTNTGASLGGGGAAVGSSANLVVGATTGVSTSAVGVPQISADSNTYASIGSLAHNATNGNHGFLLAGKSRGTKASPTILADGDTFGEVGFVAYDGVAYRTSASIRGVISGTPGAGDVPTQLSFGVAADGGGSPTDRLFLTPSGNLVVGTTNSETGLSGSGNLKTNGGVYIASSSTATTTNTGGLHSANFGLSTASGGASYFGGPLSFSGNTPSPTGDGQGFAGAVAGQGLIFQGRGSTNDLNFYNKSGSSVFAVPTGTQNFVISGTTPSTGLGTGALQVAGGIYAGAASVFGGATLTLAPAAAEATITSKGRATGTNPLATTSRGGIITLTNLDTTDNNAEAVSFHNSNDLAIASIVAQNVSHAGRTGKLYFNVSNGSAPVEALSLASTGAATFSGAVSVTNTTASTGVGTGALQVAGGIYAGAVSYFGGAVSVSAASGDTLTLLKGTGPSIKFQKTDATAQTWSVSGEGPYFRVYDATAGTTPLSIASSTGAATFAGLVFPQQATTAGAPAYVKGAIYFDTTLNKLRVGGATAWETLTSV